MTRELDPKPVTFDPDEPIEQVFRRIGTSGTTLAVAVDKRGRMKGYVHEKDIRAAVLAGTDLNDPISALLDPDRPVRTSPKDRKSDRTARALGYDSLPVVEQGRPTGVAEIDLTKELEGAIAVVMAGGRGQRLRPLTDKVPKPLLRMGRSTIVERIIGSIAQAGVTDVFLSVNYKARVFEQKLKDGSHLGVRLHYLKEEKKLDTAGSLSLLPEPARGPVIVTNADIMTRLDYRKMLRAHVLSKSKATIAAVMYEAQIPYGVLDTAGAKLVGMREKPVIRVPCNAGIYILDPSAVALVGRDEPIGMPALLQRVAEGRGRVDVFPVIERWFDIGSPEDFQKVLMEFATGEEE